MKFFHADSYDEAWRKIQQLKAEASDDAPVTIYRIRRSPYEGFSIIALNADLYADMVSTQCVDGLPIFAALDGTITEDFIP